MQTTPIRGSGSISFKLTHYPIREFVANKRAFRQEANHSHQIM